MNPTAHRFQLKLFHRDRLVETRPVDRNVIKIGRLAQSDVHLDDPGVARMHAVIEVGPSDLRLVDLGSAMGTRLNGRRVQKHARLSPGDGFEVGEYRFELEPIEEPMRDSARASAAAVDFSEFERSDATVTEVMAMYGTTVLDVQHVDQVQARRKSAPALMVLGGLLLLSGGVLFGSEVSHDWDAHRTAARQAREAGRPAPEAPGHGLGGLGVALALAGLVPFALGAVRLRERGLTAYTIGENPDVTFHAPLLGNAEGEFPLVKGRQSGGSTLHFTPGMTGHVEVQGQSMSLAELADTGRASGFGGSFRYPLPPDARCRLQYGGLSFLINEVPAAKTIARKSEADKPFWLYNAASLGVVGSLLVLTHLIPEDAMAMGLDDRMADNRFVGFIHQPDLAPEEPPVADEETQFEEEAGGQGQRAAGPEGKMGDPERRETSGAYAMKKKPNVAMQMHRSFNPELSAREAGILGMMKQDSGHFLASPFGGDFAAGADDEDVWGNLTGTEIGAAHGMGGLGLVGTGRQGGGTGEGTLGLGNVGLIGHSAGGGTGLRYGRGGGVGFRTKKKKRRRVRASRAKVHGNLDRDIIRRIVRNHINEVRYCYNQGLITDPNLSGRIAVMFAIGPTGRVKTSVVQENSLGDRGVASCVAKAVRRWKFPRPRQSGSVMVTYPFVLTPG